jgi:hypothetical protein
MQHKETKDQSLGKPEVKSKETAKTPPLPLPSESSSKAVKTKRVRRTKDQIEADAMEKAREQLAIETSKKEIIAESFSPALVSFIIVAFDRILCKRIGDTYSLDDSEVTQLSELGAVVLNKHLGGAVKHIEEITLVSTIASIYVGKSIIASLANKDEDNVK